MTPLEQLIALLNEKLGRDDMDQHIEDFINYIERKHIGASTESLLDEIHFVIDGRTDRLNSVSDWLDIIVAQDDHQFIYVFNDEIDNAIQVNEVILNSPEMIEALGGKDNVIALRDNGELFPVVMQIMREKHGIDHVVPTSEWQSYLYDRWGELRAEGKLLMPGDNPDDESPPLYYDVKAAIWDAVDDRYGKWLNRRPEGGITLEYLYNYKDLRGEYPLQDLINRGLANMIISDNPNVTISDPFLGTASPVNYALVFKDKRNEENLDLPWSYEEFLDKYEEMAVDWNYNHSIATGNPVTLSDVALSKEWIEGVFRFLDGEEGIKLLGIENASAAKERFIAMAADESVSFGQLNSDPDLREVAAYYYNKNAIYMILDSPNSDALLTFILEPTTPGERLRERLTFWDNPEFLKLFSAANEVASPTVNKSESTRPTKGMTPDQ